MLVVALFPLLYSHTHTRQSCIGWRERRRERITIRLRFAAPWQGRELQSSTPAKRDRRYRSPKWRTEQVGRDVPIVSAVAIQGEGWIATW